MAQYLSPAWLAEVKTQVATEEAILNKEFKGIDTSLKNVVRNVPGQGTVVLVFRWKDGSLVDARVGPEAELAKEPADFTMSGDYPVFVKLNKGELDSKTAIMRRELRLDGNVLKALRLNRAFDTFNAVVRKVPAEYAA